MLARRPTIDAIARHLLDGTLASAPATAAAGNGVPAPEVVERFDEAAIAAMSDDDIARLLDQRLGTP